MKDKLKNSFVEIELETGETVKATLAYILLLKLKSTNKAAYEEYNRIIMKGGQDVFDVMRIIYAGYLCALLADDAYDSAISFDEFLSVMPPDHDYTMNVYNMLVSPKKAKASAENSKN